MGDTGLFGDMKFIGEYYKPDLSWCRSVATTCSIRRMPPTHAGVVFSAVIGQTSIQVIDMNPGDKKTF